MGFARDNPVWITRFSAGIRPTYPQNPKKSPKNGFPEGIPRPPNPQKLGKIPLRNPNKSQKIGKNPPPKPKKSQKFWENPKKSQSLGENPE
jgi:hypothetical protein